MHELAAIPNIGKTQGTRIIISKLRDRWTKDDYNSLYDDLVFLIPPLHNYDTNFSINLQIDECPELSGAVQPLVRAIAEYELTSNLNAEGLVRHILRHHSGEETIKEFPWSQLDPQLKLFDIGPACGPLEATILFYLRDPSDVKKFDYKITDLRRYLDTFRGIRIYRDGFQIKPYGSKGNDWLDLDGRKQRSPEGVGQALGRWRVSNNQLIGTVIVSRKTNPSLEDRTSREGLIENGAFFDLKKFLMSGLRFLETERQLRWKRIGSEGTDEPLQESVEAVVAAVEKIQTAPVINENVLTQPSTSLAFPTSSPTQQQQKDTKLIVDERDVDNLVQRTNSLKISAEARLQEVQLLRALATMGIALATFAHEIKGSIISVLDESFLLRDSLQHLPTEMREEILRRLDVAITSAQRIENWSNFILERVKKSRRTEQVINFTELVTVVIQPFENSFMYRTIVAELEFANDIPLFIAFPIDFEAIIINLITNSVKALERVPTAKRRIKLQAAYNQTSQQLEIIFEDSGPGIKPHDLPQPQAGVQQIFEPFISGKNNDGTGMGLAVVNRIVKDLRGKISVEGQGVLGGASFKIKLPLKLIEDNA